MNNSIVLIILIIMILITVIYFIYNLKLLLIEIKKERGVKMKVEKSKSKLFMKIRKICQYIKKHINQIKQFITILLLIAMIWFIYQISPRITQIIQNIAWYISEIDGIYITRIVEILLVVSFTAPAAMRKDKEGGEE